MIDISLFQFPYRQHGQRDRRGAAQPALPTRPAQHDLSSLPQGHTTGHTSLPQESDQILDNSIVYILRSGE